MCNGRSGNLCRKAQIRETRTESHYQIAIFSAIPCQLGLHLMATIDSTTQILEFVDFDELVIVLNPQRPSEDVSCYLDTRQVGCSRWSQHSGVLITLVILVRIIRCMRNQSRDFRFVASSLARIALHALAACIS